MSSTAIAEVRGQVLTLRTPLSSISWFVVSLYSGSGGNGASKKKGCITLRSLQTGLTHAEPWKPLRELIAEGAVSVSDLAEVSNVQAR